MQLKKGQIIEFDIHAIAFGGKGLGKWKADGEDHNGMTVFVDGAIPGDRVSASLTRIKPKFAEAKLIEIVSESGDRVKPRCPYWKECGGCTFQFMNYEKQLEVKKQQTIDAFERIGKIYDADVSDVVPCDDPFYYRNKMEFSFGYDADMKFALGLHLPGRRYDILDLKECHLQSEKSTEIINVVREFAMSKKWQPRRYNAQTGYLKSLYVREGKRTGEVMVNLVTTENVGKKFEAEMNELAEKLNVTSVYWSEKIAKRGSPTRIVEHLISGAKTLKEDMELKNGDKLTFEIMPQAFFQVNTFQGEKLYSQVIDFALQDEHETVFDLFCGTGTIGLFLAKHVGNVLGIELNEDAVNVARENATKNGVFNIDFFTGDVSTVLKTVRQFPSLIVVDPPRAGLDESLIKKINDFGANRIIYVSCNPSTLARDCNWFGEYGYKVKKVVPVDMFPHTYHVENVCLLER